MSEFSALTPLYHPRMDNWGIAKRTRVWMADGGYKCVDELTPGDFVLGVSFRVEDDYLPRSRDPHDQANFVKVWRPVLRARRVLEVKEVSARPWQLTFGDENSQYENRRLIAGADTQVVLFPLSARVVLSKKLAECATAVENPRVEPFVLQAQQFDQEASANFQENVYRPTQFTGQQRGEMAVIIPHEAFGGQLSMVPTDKKPYNRYLFLQVREVKPLGDAFPLYQVKLQPDTHPETGAPLRCNMIVQTPFPQGKRKREIIADHLSRARLTAKSWDAYMQEWDHWVENHQKRQTGPTTAKKTDYESEAQGQFYLSQKPEMAKSLEQQFGIKGGFLNGGILIDVPVDVRAHAPEMPTINFRYSTGTPGAPPPGAPPQPAAVPVVRFE